MVTVRGVRWQWRRGKAQGVAQGGESMLYDPVIVGT